MKYYGIKYQNSWVINEEGFIFCTPSLGHCEAQLEVCILAGMEDAEIIEFINSESQN